MSTIHPTAIIDPSASIGKNTLVGPYCIIGENVTLGDDCELKSHVVIEGSTKIGNKNNFYPFAAIGQKTQDLKYKGEPTYLEIGDNNTFRENTTIHRSTSTESPTRIGNNNSFLAYSHVAHDCVVQNHTIFSNCAVIAGHVVVEDYVIISGLAAAHQFCKIGAHSIIGGLSKVVKDVAPFTIVDGNPASSRAINQIGLQRREFSEEDVRILRKAYKILFFKKEGNFQSAVENVKNQGFFENKHVKKLINFIESSERGVTR